MKTISLNRWDGGMADDIRNSLYTQSEKSLNFDIFSNPHKLIPFPDSTPEAIQSLNMDDIELSDVDISLISGNYYLTASGYESSSLVRPVFYTKTEFPNNWVAQTTGPSTTYQKNSGVVYKDKFYALGLGASSYSLYRFEAASSVTTVGTIATTSSFYAKPFVHPEDNKLYIGIGNTITSYDGTTLTTSTTILPSGYEVTSLTNYGGYLAIAMRPIRGNGNSIVYLWGRDTSLNTLQAAIDFGEGSLNIIENIDNLLVGISVSRNSYGSSLRYSFSTKIYSGGIVETIKTLPLSSGSGYNSLKVKNGNKLYFGFSNDDCIYVFGKNKSGLYTVTKDRYYYNGTTVNIIGGLSMIGDSVFVGFYNLSGVYLLHRSMISYLSETRTYTSTSTYKTVINPGMPDSDKYENKQLTRVQIAYTGASSGSTVVKYSVDGSVLTTAISQSNATGEQIYEAWMQNDGSPFLAGREFQFQIESTGGSEIKEIKYSYDIISN